MQALIKRDMLLAASCELLNTNFCERNQFLVCIKRLSKFSVQMLRDMYLIFSGCYKQEYRSPIKHFTQM